MTKPDQSSKDFKISYDSMLQDSRTTLGHFTEDVADFSALDADFDPAKVPNFATQWNASIEAAAVFPSDEELIDTQAGLSLAVETAIEACRNHFQMAKYYIEKAFPAKKSVWNEFGYDNYDDARKSADKMITFMTVFGKIAEKYKPQLLAVNYAEASIDAIATKKQALTDAKVKQEMAKNSRTGATDERIKLMNAVWGFRTRVARAAKNIYADNFGKYEIYLLPASEETAPFSISGTVTNNASAKALTNVAVSLGAASVSTTTDSSGNYGFAKLKNETYTLTFSLAGYTTASKEVTFDGKPLVVDMALEAV